MKLIILLALLSLAGCASKPVVVKECIQAADSNLFVCYKP